jgi:2',3'-cyclic-nucleotide 2'-phosphodiesterase (5'-nucleotidase family)
MARWASLVDKRRSERGTILIDTGDFSLPHDTRSRALKERYFFEAMKLLRYDAVGVGDVETRDGFLAAAERRRLPLVSSNLRDRATKESPAAESIVKEVGGSRTLFGRRGAVRVGIFAVVLPSFVYRNDPNNRPKYDVIDPKLASLAAAANLRARGCDLVIAVSHLGWGNSLELARDVPGIDLVLNGHRDHPRTHLERVGSTAVVDAGEKEWSFPEVTVTFHGDSLEIAAVNACGEALAMPADPRLGRLQENYAAELRRGDAPAAKR